MYTLPPFREKKKATDVFSCRDLAGENKKAIRDEMAFSVD